MRTRNSACLLMGWAIRGQLWAQPFKHGAAGPLVTGAEDQWLGGLTGSRMTRPPDALSDGMVVADRICVFSHRFIRCGMCIRLAEGTKLESYEIPDALVG